MEPRYLDKEANLRNVLTGLDADARRGARLVVFQECALTGYCSTSLAEAMLVAEGGTAGTRKTPLPAR